MGITNCFWSVDGLNFAAFALSAILIYFFRFQNSIIVEIAIPNYGFSRRSDISGGSVELTIISTSPMTVFYRLRFGRLLHFVPKISVRLIYFDVQYKEFQITNFTEIFNKFLVV